MTNNTVVDLNLLRCTMEGQLSPKLTFALTGTTYGTGNGVPVARSFMSGSCMRIADIRKSRRGGVRMLCTEIRANGIDTRRSSVVMTDLAGIDPEHKFMA